VIFAVLIDPLHLIVTATQATWVTTLMADVTSATHGAVVALLRYITVILAQQAERVLHFVTALKVSSI
jgi:hypothetical protein